MNLTLLTVGGISRSSQKIAPVASSEDLEDGVSKLTAITNCWYRSIFRDPKPKGIF